ncbi:MAG TPA: Fic family protein [Polyangia bacterium]|nr:Fic family protein [Polyangia bacterium]
MLWRGLLALAVGLAVAATARAADRAARVARPSGAAWSDGPTLYLKQQVAAGMGQDNSLPRREKLRLRALDWGSGETIPINQDLRNYLAGHGNQQGALAELWAARRAASGTSRAMAERRQLLVQAHESRQRVQSALRTLGFESADQDRLAELMVWRNLAYGSSTLAHGSTAPGGPANEDAQRRARDGLRDAVAKSFVLGDRLAHAAALQDGGQFLHFADMLSLHAEAAKGFPDKEPGQVRWVNFEWPFNSFGVDYPRLHGRDGEIARFERFLRSGSSTGPKGRPVSAFTRQPLQVMARSLYWLHNIHPFRDGNGRTEVLTGWALARGAGYPLPIEYDQASGDFRLAATKWGGTALDLRDFLARGALASERFLNALRPLLEDRRVLSVHTDQGAVGTVVARRSGSGERSLLVMLPVTHALANDSELSAEVKRGRAVLTGGSFDPEQITIEFAVDGKHGQWRTLRPAAIHDWDARYPWWSTAEPVFQIDLPFGYQFVNFRVLGPGGQNLGADDYYMDLR